MTTVPVIVTFQNVDASPAVRTKIRRKAGQLERFADRMRRCDVVVEAPHRRHNKGRLYQVRIHVSVPGKEMHVVRTGPGNHAHENVYVAIRAAFNAVTRQLEDHVGRRRSGMKTHGRPVEGVVAKLYADGK